MISFEAGLAQLSSALQAQKRTGVFHRTLPCECITSRRLWIDPQSLLAPPAAPLATSRAVPESIHPADDLGTSGFDNVALRRVAAAS